MRPAPVRVAPVKEERIEQRYRVTGNLRARARARVSAREEDRVIDMIVREGFHVKKDDVLARMDTRRLDARLSEERAEQEVAKAIIAEFVAQVKRDLRELERLKQIENPDAVSKQDIELAESVLLGTLEDYHDRHGPTHQYTRRVEENLAELYEAWGRPEENRPTG